jgi:hypothetical protein
MGLSHTVAQTTHVGEAVMWLAVMLVVVVVGALVVLALRRRLQGEDEGEREGLDLGVLRRMRAEGRLTEAEYEAARAAIVARHGVSEAGPTVSPLDPRTVRARPGVDLTGAPLPKPQRGAEGAGERDPGGSGGTGPEN